eukprot:Blabericola_migrator_1__6472@NODE_3264_length_1897_cov_137_186885_g2043_i0_p2_GENE_NODE_3264_length_1897_cov_137_186885_g2043_i0NODE_3264_length_1897_cov_137_186885_g2043_i0_p2_ORF_typecomplete_len149_score39_39TBCA/PF02970_16/3_1e07TBCA/PF02970_16/3_8e02TMP_2/PF06791_13/0_035TCTP/PF00838_17/0_17FtsL/PF04999_13/0_3FtsL/PF04999_13/1_1e04Fungal_TACC/PF12709_7/1_4e02Fungal_TACC/PF12709_7/1_1_NODE_3264_length_1897_cov_137_186885_g2043_i014121858
MAPKEGVPGILHDLKMKAASLQRCYTEYGTYVDELEADKKRLEEAKAKGSDTRQLEAVVKETADMIPITQRNTQKICDGYIEFYNSKVDALKQGLEDGPDKEAEKWKKDLAAAAKNLEKMFKRPHNPLNGLGTTEVKRIQNELDTLSR